MAIADDFSVAVNGDIRYTGTTTNYTVIELHRFLQDLADNASSSGNDLLDITDDTPSDRSTDNIITLNSPYNIDDTAAQHLYDGSITQAGGDTVYSGLVVVGTVEALTQLILVQDNALITDYWGTGLNVDAAANIILRMLVNTRLDGSDIDAKKLIVMSREFGDSYAEFSVTMGLGNSVAAIFTAADLNNETVQGTVNAWPITNTEGYQLLEISGTAPAEAYYSQWALNSQGINDLYEFAKDIQRRGTAETIHGINGSLFRGITTDVAYNTESGGPFVEDEVIAWGTTLNYDNEITGPFVVGEAIGFGTSGAVGVIRELTDAGATGSMVVQIEPGTGTVIDGEQISQLDGGTATADVAGTPVGTANVGGAGILIALYDNGTDGNLYLQVTNGTAPAAGYVLTGATSGATAAVNGSPVARTIAPVFIGSSTGSSLIGAYGIGAVPGDLSSSDKVFDLGNNLVTPPNNVTFTVFGLESGEDRVLVGPEAGGVIEFAQLTLDGLHNSGTTLTIVEDIPLDTPTAGTLRVLDDDGTYKLLNVSSWTGKVFTLDAAITDTFSDTANVWISYIDKAAAAASESFTGVYLSDRALFIRVRDGGVSPIKTFETTGTLGESGGSTTAIRTDDS